MLPELTTNNIEINNFFDPLNNQQPSKRRKKKDRRLQRKISNQNCQTEILNINHNLREIYPITDTQRDVFDEFDRNNLCLSGYAGSGKSMISLYLSLDKILHDKKEYKKLIIIRSTVPSREIGFLPGDKNSKTKEYELPYKTLVDDMFHRKNTYESLKEKGIIEFHPTSFLRGNTFSNCIVYFDEIQNATYQELTTVITRMGNNAKLILSGDYHQCDLVNTREKTGIIDILNILKRMNGISIFNFTEADIVRSKFIKEFLITEKEYRDEKRSNQT